MTPGRWAVLAIAVPVALALIGWTGFGLVAAAAHGSYQFGYDVPVQDGQVAINVNYGNVTLHPGASSSTARLTGSVQYGLDRPSISEWTASAVTNLSLDCGGMATGNCGLNSTLNAPDRTAVTLWSNGGDIVASGFSSGLALSAAGGNISASNLAGNIQLDTGGGDLNADGLTGTLRAAAEGGNINASNWTTTRTMRVDTGGGEFFGNGLTGSLLLGSEGGDVQAFGVNSAVADIQSGGGNVIVNFIRAPQNLHITAMGGNVIVVLPPGATTYDISTPDTAGGDVLYPSSLASSSSHRTITIDSGGGNIAISQS